MKKNYQICLLGLMTAAALTACGSKADAGKTDAAQDQSGVAQTTDAAQNQEAGTGNSSADAQTGSGAGNLQIGNPWTDTDRQGLLDATGFELDAPEGATDVAYRYMQEIGATGETDSSAAALAELDYDLDGTEWTYRVQSASELTDISGMNYAWIAEEDGTVADRPAKYYSYVEYAKPEDVGAPESAAGGIDYIDSTFAVQVVNWYDAAPGVTYSLSATGTDLNGMDIQVFAENLFNETQGEVSGEDDADAELKDYFLGEHERSYDGSKLKITDLNDGTFGVDIDIVRLCQIEGGVGSFDEHKITFKATDPNEDPIEGVIYRDADNSLVVKFTNSTWGYLPNGETLDGFGK